MTDDKMLMLIPLRSSSPSFQNEGIYLSPFLLPAFHRTVFDFCLEKLSGNAEIEHCIFVTDGTRELETSIDKHLVEAGFNNFTLLSIPAFSENWPDKIQYQKDRPFTILNLAQIIREEQIIFSDQRAFTPDDYYNFLLSGPSAPYEATPLLGNSDNSESRNPNVSIASLEKLTNTATTLIKLGRTDDAKSLFLGAQARAQKNLADSHLVAKAMVRSQLFQMALNVYDSALENFPHDSEARFLGAKCLVKLKRGHEVDLYLGPRKFLDIDAANLEELSYLICDHGFSPKAERILDANWKTRPDASLLHARLKLLARKGLGRARMNQILIALETDIPVRVSDRLHGASIAERMGNNQALQLLCASPDPMNRNLAAPSILAVKPKVALCLSGQMRGYEICAPSIFHHVIQKHDADVFVSTWDKQGSSTPAWRHFVRLLPNKVSASISKRHSKAQFAKSFPRLVDIIEGKSSNKVTISSVKKSYPNATVQVLSEQTFEDRYLTSSVLTVLGKNPILKNQMKMCYQIAEANRLKSVRESELDEKYDIVIRMRPDLKLGGCIVPEVDSFGFDVYTEFVHGAGCGDQICTSSSENMDLLALVWDRCLRIVTGGADPAIDGNRKNIGGHGFFSETLWLNGLAPRANPKPDGTELVNTPLDFPSAAEAMLRDMLEWDRFDQQDRNCAKAIIDELRSNSNWQNELKTCAGIIGQLQ